MKELKRLLICCGLLTIVFSCSDNPDTSQQIDSEINAVEKERLNPEVVSQGITIPGATLVEGAVPTPNGGIPFNMGYTSQSGFQTYGFDITFKAPSTFSGAYVQLLDNTGTPLSSYFDIPAGAMGDLSGKREKRSKTNLFGKNADLNPNDDTLIDVNFDASINAGTFCYVICLYDTQGNISDPVEVCVEIESWAGNAAMVAGWNYESSVEDGEVFYPNIEYCDDYPVALNCDSGQILEVNNINCYTTNKMTLVIKSDGTYEYESESTDKNYDHDQTIAQCNLTWQENERYTYISKGKWAYNEEKDILTLVEFEWTEGDPHGILDETLWTGTNLNGDLSFNGNAAIVSGKLRISETEAYNGVTNNYEYYFTK